MAIQSFSVTGMTCGHCVHAVTEEISGLEGVRNVDVQLVPEGTSIVSVEAAAELTNEQVAEALDEAGGYVLASA